MNLQQIDTRLDLFPEYLKDKMESPLGLIQLNGRMIRKRDPEYLMKIFNEQGYMFYDKSELNLTSFVKTISFDDWLWQKGKYELCMLEDVTCLQDIPEASGPHYFQGDDVMAKMWAEAKPKQDIRLESTWGAKYNTESRLNRFFMPSYEQTVKIEREWR